MTTSSSPRALSSKFRLIPPRPIPMPPAPPSKRSASPLRSCVIELTVHGFGHQRVHGAGRRVDEARPAAQEKPVPEENAQEIDRRIEQQFEARRLPPQLQPLLGLEPRIADFLLHLLVERQRAFVAKEPLAGDRRLALVGDEAFVDDERGVEAGSAAANKAQDVLRPRPWAYRLRLPVE